MKKLVILLLLLNKSLFALSLDIHLKLKENNFEFLYEFSKPIERFIFTHNQEASLIFKNLYEMDGSILVQGKSLTIESRSFDKVLFTGNKTKFFLLNDKTFMIYSYALDAIKVGLLSSNTQEIIENINYFHKGKLIHTRDIHDESSFEKYLIVEGESTLSKMEHSLATLYIDTDLPHRQFHLAKINKALKYLYLKFGNPISRPTVFFSYQPGTEDDIFLDGRNLMHDNVIMLTAGSLEQVDLQAENFRLYFYNLLYSHEIIHHWTSKNLDSKAHGWVHEGATEAISHIMVKEVFYQEVGDMADYMKDYNYNHCQMRTAVFDFAYHCGAVIWDQVFQNITSKSNPFQIMKEVMELPKQSEAAVLKVFSKHTSSEVMKRIELLVNSKNEE